MEDSYEPTNAELLAQVQQLQTTLAAIAAHVGLDPILATIAPATDFDLNSEWGNPTLDRSPKGWSGEQLEGRQMSDLHPTTLRALAREYAKLAAWHDSKKNVDGKGRPKGNYARRDAARALGWALRLEQRGQRGPGAARPAARPQHREERHPAPAERPQYVGELPPSREEMDEWEEVHQDDNMPF